MQGVEVVHAAIAGHRAAFGKAIQAAPSFAALDALKHALVQGLYSTLLFKQLAPSVASRLIKREWMNGHWRLGLVWIFWIWTLNVIGGHRPISDIRSSMMAMHQRRVGIVNAGRVARICEVIKELVCLFARNSKQFWVQLHQTATDHVTGGHHELGAGRGNSKLPNFRETLFYKSVLFHTLDHSSTHFAADLGIVEHKVSCRIYVFKAGEIRKNLANPVFVFWR